MSTILPILLSWLQEYGYPVLWLSVFVASVGVPLPIGLLLLAAGAFAALGDFDIVLLTVMAVTASICGDSLGYLIGRRLGHKVLIWLERRLVAAERIKRSQEYFKRRGAWAIFLSRFLFSAFGGVVNLLAGTEEYPYRRFLLYDATGETIGALLPLSLGYVFGVSWEAVGDILGGVSLFALGLLFTTYLTVRLIKNDTTTCINTTGKGGEPGFITCHKRQVGGSGPHRQAPPIGRDISCDFPVTLNVYTKRDILERVFCTPDFVIALERGADRTGMKEGVAL